MKITIIFTVLLFICNALSGANLAMAATFKSRYHSFWGVLWLLTSLGVALVFLSFQNS